MILAVRADKPTAELYLLSGKGCVIHKDTWVADRQLGHDLLVRIQNFVHSSGVKTEELGGIVVYSGSGSFTGLRISTTVANAMAYSLGIKVAVSSGVDWLNRASADLRQAKLGVYQAPTYERPPNIS